MTFTVAEARSAAERLAAEQQAIAGTVAYLEDHLGRRLLDSTAVEGRTRDRKAALLDDFELLWTLYESYRSTAGRVQKIMAGSRPTPAGLHEVEALVSGATVTLPGSDAAVADRVVTLDELLAEMRAICDRITQTVAVVDRVWTELTPRVESCEARSRRAAALAEDLGLAGSQDPAARELAELTGKLGELRRTVRADPLTLWADGRIADTAADELAGRFEQILADLNALAELREDAAARLDRVENGLAELRAVHREIIEERRLASIKIQPGPGRPAGTPSAAPLGARLAAAVELHGRGDWRRLTTELTALEQDTGAALQQAKAELLEAAQPLRERNELRGLLSAYRAKAADRGRVEDLPLEQLYRRARTLLWQAPCDLAVAAAAVTKYQHAVNEPPDGEGPG